MTLQPPRLNWKQLGWSCCAMWCDMSRAMPTATSVVQMGGSTVSTRIQTSDIALEAAGEYNAERVDEERLETDAHFGRS